MCVCLSPLPIPGKVLHKNVNATSNRPKDAALLNSLYPNKEQFVLISSHLVQQEVRRSRLMFFLLQWHICCILTIRLLVRGWNLYFLAPIVFLLMAKGQQKWWGGLTRNRYVSSQWSASRRWRRCSSAGCLMVRFAGGPGWINDRPELPLQLKQKPTKGFSSSFL